MRRTPTICAAFALAALLCACGTEPPGEIRRLLLISVDTCRADRLGCYGFSGAATPNLDALAARATLFTNAIAPTPITLPSHATLLTGTTPPRHGVHDNAYDLLGPDSLTLAEMLAARDWATGAVVSAFVLDRRFGLDQGFDDYDDRLVDPAGGRVVAENRGDTTTDRAIDWVERHRDESFFLFVHYYDPHAPYDPPEPYASRFADDPYAGEIAFVDAQIGRLLDRLEALDIDESTLVVVTADHGEMLSEHGEQTHTYFIYQGALRIPLIVRLPGQNEPHRIDTPVGLVDIVPTLAGLIGLDVSGVEGADLSAALTEHRQGPADAAIYSESFTPTKYGAAPLFGLSTGRHKFIESPRPELYDLLADPAETENLLATERDTADRLRDDLLARIQQNGSGPTADTLDDLSRRRLESLGYVSGAPVGGDPSFDDAKDLLEAHRLHTAVAAEIAAGRLEEARALADALVALRPDYVGAHVNLARISRELESPDAAVEHYGRALELAPARADLLNDLGLVLAVAGRPAEAIDAYRKALERDPDFLDARNNFANALLRAGDRPAAIEQYRITLDRHPESATTWLNLGLALSSSSNYPEAILAFGQALERGGDNPRARYLLGRALARTGQVPAALEQLSQAAEGAAGWGAPRTELAWILATHPDQEVRAPGRAVQLAERGLELSGDRDARAFDVLAAAYAAAGDFPRATEAATRALAVAGPERGEPIRRRLELYRREQPYRLTPN